MVCKLYKQSEKSNLKNTIQLHQTKLRIKEKENLKAEKHLTYKSLLKMEKLIVRKKKQEGRVRL